MSEYHDLGAALAALDHAVVADFVRFVQRTMYENGTDFEQQPFKDGWMIVLGRYAEKAARNV